jgi:hypothetical protein
MEEYYIGNNGQQLIDQLTVRGRIKEITYYNLARIVFYQFDDRKNLIHKSDMVDGDGYIWNYTYDFSSNLIHKRDSRHLGNQSFHYEDNYKYNKGILERIIQSDIGGNFCKETKVEFSRCGNLNFRSETTNSEIEVYVYDDLHRLIE